MQNAPHRNIANAQQRQQSQQAQNDCPQDLAQSQFKQNTDQSPQDAAAFSGYTGLKQRPEHGKAAGQRSRLQEQMHDGRCQHHEQHSRQTAQTNRPTLSQNQQNK